MSIYIIILSIIFLILGYIFFPLFQTRLFDKYFQIYSEEVYNLDDLFPIKIEGKVVPKVDFLDIPYEKLNIEINTKTIRGNIINNILSLELIKPKDRKTSVYLIKTHYIKAVKPYIIETIKTKKEYIDLINISVKQKHKLEKIACKTCRYKTQCKISFTECNYEKTTRDPILSKGIKVNTDRNYELNNLNK